MAQPDAAGEKTGGYGLLALLALMNVLNFVDRQLLSSFANYIMPDLGLTNTEFGLLTGLVFILFYAVAGLFMGGLADLVNRPRLIATAMVVWSALTAASGLAKNFITLAIPRVFIGVGESALTPTALSLLADRFPPSKLGFATGAYYMGVPVGVGVSLLVAGVLGEAIGWRNCFFLLGALGVAFSLIIYQVKDPRTSAAHTEHAPRPKLGELVSTFFTALRGSGALQLTMLAGILVHLVLGAAAFDQVWLVKERGFERGEIAIISGVVATIAGVVGNLFGGLASDRWMRKPGRTRAMFMVWMLLALLPVNLCYRLAPAGNPLFWIGICVAYFQLGAFYGPTFSAVQELCPAKVRSTVVAFYLMVLNVVGLGLGITLSGVVMDQLIARGVDQPYSWTLFVFTCLSGLAIPCYAAAAMAVRRAQGAVGKTATAAA